MRVLEHPIRGLSLDAVEPPTSGGAGSTKGALEVNAQHEAVGGADAKTVLAQVALTAAVLAVTVGTGGFEHFGDNEVTLAPTKFGGESGFAPRHAHGEREKTRFWKGAQGIFHFFGWLLRDSDWHG